MYNIAILFVIGIVSGAAIGLQGPMASVITQKLGVFESVFIVHIGGAIAALIPLVFFLRGGNLSRWRELPWYVFLAGLFGLVVLSAISYLIPRIGVSPAIMLIIVGQIVIGAVLDHFGLLGTIQRTFSLKQLAGIGVMLAGVWMTVR